MSETTNQKIIDKLQKLLRLAKGNTSEAEAQAAMAKVHELLAQHNLDMSQIEAGNDEAPEGVAGKRGRTTGKNNGWETHLYAGAALLNFCFYYTIRHYRGAGTIGLQHVIVGKPINVMASEMLGDYLLETVNRLVKQIDFSSPQVQMEVLMSGTSEAMYKHKFKQGCAMRLRLRCMELQKLRAAQPTKAADGRNLPALADAYHASKQEIDLFLKKEVPDIRTTASKVKQTGGFQAGARAANSVSLDLQIGGETRMAGLSLPSK